MEVKTYGKVPPEPATTGEHLTLAFSPLSAPVRSRWRSNGISADFLSDYVLTFLPREGEGEVPAAAQNELRHAVSYVANELLENAMKYHEKVVGTPISLRMELSRDHVTITLSNGMTGDQAESYREFVEKFLSGDPEELLMQRLELNGQGNAEGSGLGLLTIRSDYGAELGWEFRSRPENPGLVDASTSAMIPLTNILGVSQ